MVEGVQRSWSLSDEGALGQAGDWGEEVAGKGAAGRVEKQRYCCVGCAWVLMPMEMLGEWSGDDV